MNKKVIFLDLDGTLLNNQKEIPMANRIAMEEAVRRGHKVIICTGRPLSSVIRLLPEFGLDKEGCYAVAFNGGLIYDAGSRKVIWKKTLSTRQVKHIFEKACEYGKIHVQTYNDQGFLCEHDTPESLYYEKSCRCKRILVGDVFSELDGAEPCKVLTIAYNFDRQHLEGFREFMSEWAEGQLEVYFSCKEYLEFMPLGIDKGNAVRFMAEYLDIPMENTIAVGDEENDISMIQTAGIGAVMKNASDRIKQYGNYITGKDNNEGGVAEVIEKFMID